MPEMPRRCRARVADGHYRARVRCRSRRIPAFAAQFRRRAPQGELMVCSMNTMSIKPPRHEMWLPRDTPRPEQLNAVAETVLPAGRRHSAQQHIRNWPGYGPTPLVALPGVADWLGLSVVWCKDE